MTRILLVGQEPETVDFSDPALPKGMTAEKIHAGLAVAMKQMADRGWEADMCLVAPDGKAGAAVAKELKANTYHCVVIGAGIRVPPDSLVMFEAIVNAIRRTSPNAAIGFNTRPEDSAESAARALRA
jgi:hypothetical protein